MGEAIVEVLGGGIVMIAGIGVLVVMFMELVK